ncbi:MAG: response regulator [Lentimicrobiaceae bacterium]|nr:response regulator [Lentimicrobiaceae bacterium]
MRKTTILVIEDDRSLQTDPFVLEVSAVFENVIFKENANDALSFVKENLNAKMIILLDLAFPANQMQGIKFLEELRNVSKLIPIIIWSGKDSILDAEYQTMINDSTFAFLSKSASSEKITKILCKADEHLIGQIDTAIENWLEKHSDEEKNKPFLTSANGNSYSMNDLLREIRMQTLFGQSIALDINNLTLDLLFRNKEEL